MKCEVGPSLRLREGSVLVSVFMCLNILSHFHKQCVTGEVKGCYLGHTCLADMAHVLY